MIWKRCLSNVIIVALTLAIMGGCVSKKEFLGKVEEGGRLSGQLDALRAEHNRLKAEKGALEERVAALERERDDLGKAKAQIQFNLEEGIARLRDEKTGLAEEIARLKDERTAQQETFQAKSDALAKTIQELKAQLEDSKSQNGRLMEEIEALQSRAKGLELQRMEDVLAMKGTYENLLEDMKSEIEKGKITITQLEGKLKVNMLDEILFDSGKTTIKPQGLEVLKKVGKILLNVKDKAISIEGHTDDVPIGATLKPQYPTNWELSAARATNVARYLQENVGIDPKWLSATGYGQHQPVASNETEEGRAKNRRIEIILVPKEIAPGSRTSFVQGPGLV